MPSSGMWRRVDIFLTDVSEERISSPPRKPQILTVSVHFKINRNWGIAERSLLDEPVTFKCVTTLDSYMKFQDAFMVKSIKLLNVSWSFHPPPS
jgi:hypothetical protein